jgi:hypothetical protein
MVTIEISESADETVTKKPSQPAAVEIVQKHISGTYKINWLHKRNVRQSQTRGIGI